MGRWQSGKLWPVSFEASESAIPKECEDPFCMGQNT